MARSKPTEFAVEGDGVFPVDMLRHDRCWPRSTEDAVRMVDRAGFWARSRRVELVTGDGSTITAGRWESFGWKVVSKRAIG